MSEKNIHTTLKFASTIFKNIEINKTQPSSNRVGRYLHFSQTTLRNVGQKPPTFSKVKLL